MDPERIWKSIREVIRESAAKAAHDKVQALCASILGVAVTPLDRSGRPLYNSLTAVDGRSLKQATWLEQRLGREKIFQATGVVRLARLVDQQDPLDQRERARGVS